MEITVQNDPIRGIGAETGLVNLSCVSLNNTETQLPMVRTRVVLYACLTRMSVLLYEQDNS